MPRDVQKSSTRKQTVPPTITKLYFFYFFVDPLGPETFIALRIYIYVTTPTPTPTTTFIFGFFVVFLFCFLRHEVWVVFLLFCLFFFPFYFKKSLFSLFLDRCCGSSLLAVKRSYLLQLSDIPVFHRCQSWLSSKVVHGDCLLWLLKKIVFFECSKWLSFEFVNANGL